MWPGGINLKPRNLIVPKKQVVPPKKISSGMYPLRKKDASPKKHQPAKIDFMELDKPFRVPRESRESRESPESRKLHEFLKKRLGTDGQGVPRILGISLPVYTAFMEGR